MSLKHAILGFLDFKPLSGYDLKKLFDSSVRFYWSANHSQIYRTLNEMKRDELVSIEVIQQDGLPNKKVYHITEKGTDELLKWLRHSPELPPIRHKMLIQIFWADHLSNEDIVEILKDYAGRLEERLEAFEVLKKEGGLEHPRTDREGLLWEMVIDNGVEITAADLRWTLKAIEKVGSMENISTSTSSR